MPVLSDEDLELLGGVSDALFTNAVPGERALAGTLQEIANPRAPLQRDEAVKRLRFTDALILEALAGKGGPGGTGFLRAATIVKDLLEVPHRFR